jgi:hypothetical protein
VERTVSLRIAMARFVRRLFLVFIAGTIAFPILTVVGGLATTARADCAIGSDCFQIETASGPPGTKVRVTATTVSDCADQVEHPRPWLQFYRPGPGGGYGAAAEMFPIAEGTWSLTVPAGLTDGRWKLETYCVSDGDGPIRALPVSAVFTVTGAPDTSTDHVEQRPPRSPDAIGWGAAVLSGSLAFLWAMRRRSPRRREG